MRTHTSISHRHTYFGNILHYARNWGASLTHEFVIRKKYLNKQRKSGEHHQKGFIIYWKICPWALLYSKYVLCPNNATLFYSINDRVSSIQNAFSYFAFKLKKNTKRMRSPTRWVRAVYRLSGYIALTQWNIYICLYTISFPVKYFGVVWELIFAPEFLLKDSSLWWEIQNFNTQSWQ